jgi:hypothetical protein
MPKAPLPAPSGSRGATNQIGKNRNVSDIFISYAREDRVRAKQLAEAFKAQGWSVFWDRTIPPGKTWRKVIGTALHEARCVIVVWSEASILSSWVCEEAEEGRERDILVPVFFDEVRPPIGFGSIQAASLVNWDGGPTAEEFQELVSAVADILGLPKEPPAPRVPPQEPEPVPPQQPESLTPRESPREISGVADILGSPNCRAATTSSRTRAGTASATGVTSAPEEPERDQCRRRYPRFPACRAATTSSRTRAGTDSAIGVTSTPGEREREEQKRTKADPMDCRTRTWGRDRWVGGRPVCEFVTG